MDRRGGKQSHVCQKCGGVLRAIFGNLERTYTVFLCGSCNAQTKQVIKG